MRTKKTKMRTKLSHTAVVSGCIIVVMKIRKLFIVAIMFFFMLELCCLTERRKTKNAEGGTINVS